jgi:hypothetical protein
MKVKVSRGTLLDICEQRINHILKKNADYGDAWQNNEGFTPLLRMREKLLRVETLSDGRKAMVEDESVDQDVAEIFDYALLYMLWKAWQPKLGESVLYMLWKAWQPKLGESVYEKSRQMSYEELGNFLGGMKDEESEWGDIRNQLRDAVAIVFGIDPDLLDDSGTPE